MPLSESSVFFIYNSKVSRCTFYRETHQWFWTFFISTFCYIQFQRSSVEASSTAARFAEKLPWFLIVQLVVGWPVQPFRWIKTLPISRPFLNDINHHSTTLRIFLWKCYWKLAKLVLGQFRMRQNSTLRYNWSWVVSTETV